MDNFVELFFIVVRKDNYVCYTEQGPFLTEEIAQALVTGNEKVSSRCFREVVKVKLPCEFVEAL